MRPPTAAQMRVLTFIRTFTREHGFPPTVREIARGLKFRSSYGADCHLRWLERKGLVRRNHDGTSRSLWLTEDAEALFREQSKPDGNFFAPTRCGMCGTVRFIEASCAGCRRGERAVAA